jgi:hypothetical protein
MIENYQQLFVSSPVWVSASRKGDWPRRYSARCLSPFQPSVALKGQPHASPGHRPRVLLRPRPEALKGRNNPARGWLSASSPLLAPEGRRPIARGDNPWFANDDIVSAPVGAAEPEHRRDFRRLYGAMHLSLAQAFTPGYAGRKTILVAPFRGLHPSLQATIPPPRQGRGAHIVRCVPIPKPSPQHALTR